MLRALLLLGGLAPTLPAGPHWAYEGPHGQQHWPQGHPACGGRAQSPIDIQRRGAQPDPSLPPLGYQHPTAPTFALANNGHTAVLVLPPTLQLRGLPRPFAAAQLHFHWGRPGRAGAEHLLDGHRAPAEMHVVHYDAERYANASEAQHHAGGLAVLGVLLEVGADPHPAYDNILSHLGSIRYAACRTCCPPAWTSTTATTGPSPPPRASRGSSGPSSSSPSTSAWRSWSSSREPFMPRRRPSPSPSAWWIIFGSRRSSTSGWCCRPSPGSPRGIRQVKSSPLSSVLSAAASAFSSLSTSWPRGFERGGRRSRTSCSKPPPAARPTMTPTLEPPRCPPALRGATLGSAPPQQWPLPHWK
ncbi:carbonic anhydrase 14 isoform X2 [Falco cherrug]|uniref:carbonic anhydrase 14 isoform X2 n=2 Tax=Falco TaxID=8952 RepID=UPI002479EED5|nr:carbonic anhydrase 14 isoform X2 [Falco cherrug]